MSVDLMTRVWKSAPVGGSELLVLLALADFGNDDGSGIYPSVKTIAHKARLSEDQARRLIHKLIALNLVELVEVGGWDGKRNRANEYKITMQGTCADASTVPAPMQVPSPRRCKGGARADASTGTSTDTSTVPAPMRDDPSLEPLEQPLEQPLEEPSEESSSSGEEEEKPSPRGVVHAAWRDAYGEPLPANLIALIDGLTVETSADAVIHAIEAAVSARSRNFSYIAKCARNYVPPAPPPPAPSYTVDLPAAGVYALPPAAKPVPTVPPAHAPLDHGDPWAVCVAELRRELPGGYVGKLDGSRLEAAGEVLDAHSHSKPLYRVIIAADKAVGGLNYFEHQAGQAIRRKLGSVLGQPVLVEIVAEPIEQPITQEEPAHA